MLWLLKIGKVDFKLLLYFSVELYWLKKREREKINLWEYFKFSLNLVNLFPNLQAF